MEILARPEYARFRPSVTGAWLADLLDAIGEWLRHLPVLRETAPVLYWSLLIGSLLSAALLIAHIAWTIRRALTIQTTAGEARLVGAPRDFAGEAERLAVQGAYLEAAHRMLLATLAHSARHDLLELLPQDSNRVVCEKLQRAALPGALRAKLVALVKLTDAAWFGSRPDDSALLDAWREAFEQLRKTVR